MEEDIFGSIPVKKIVKQSLARFVNEVSELSQHESNIKCIYLKEKILNYLKQQGQTQKKALIQQFKTFSRVNQIPKTKGRLCGGLLARGQKAFKCHDCMTEENSIQCLKCFQLDKHEGHDFQKIEVFGGCCDCGDIQKWRKEGFCSQHSQDKQVEIILDQKLLDLFLQEQIYALSIMQELYLKCIQFQQSIKNYQWEQGDDEQQNKKISIKLKSQIIAKARIIIDFIGVHFVTQLIEFNKAGKFANAMTDAFLKTELQLVYVFENELKKIKNSVMNNLFTMLNLKKTPQKICDLFITLFPMEGIRQKLTCLYIHLYNNVIGFANSSYSHLSSQLFTSHLLISKLIREQKMEAIHYTPVCQNQADVQSVSQGYLRYYYDIKYLGKLHGNASVEYFKLHARQKKFVGLGHYRLIFNDYERAVDYYGLDEIYLQRIMNVIKVIEKDDSNEISNLALGQLYQFITTFPTKIHNKFRPQERLFALIVFMRMKGDLSLLDDFNCMKNIFEIIGVKQFRKEVTHILENVGSIFNHVATLLENTYLIYQNYTFFSFYLKKSQMLFNCDALFLKIIYKMIVYYNITSDQQSIQIDSLLLQKEISPRQALISLVKQESYQGITNNGQNLLKQTFTLIKRFKNFTNIVIEALYSDLPSLAIMCILEPTEQQIKYNKRTSRMPYQKIAFHYYKCLLQSQETKSVLTKQFKIAVQSFFKEQRVFKEFVRKFKDPNDSLKLMKGEESGAKICEIYFKSMNAIPQNKYLGYLPPPFMSWSAQIELNCLLDNIQQAFKLIKLVFHRRSLDIKGDVEAVFIQQLQKQRSADLRQLIIQLWKLSLLAESNKPANLLKKILQISWISRQSQKLGIDLLGTISSKSQQMKIIEQKDRKSELKKKMMQKKLLLNAKMQRNTEMILSRSSDNMAEEVKSQMFCCLCKDVSQSQNLSLQGFVTFTTGNGWMNFEKDFFPIPIFDSCGHTIHLSCYQKILNSKKSINRVYNHCPICKNPTNILFSMKQQYKRQDLNQFYAMLKKVYQTLQYKLNQIDLGYLICKSIAFQIIFKGCLLKQVFLKNLRVYKKLYSLLECWLENKPQSINQEHPQHINNIWNYINRILLQQPIKNNKFSKNFLTKIFELVQMLKGESFEEQLISDPPQYTQIRFTIRFAELQKNLGEMNSKNRGKCPQCAQVTNLQVICLSCPSFVTCTTCQIKKPGAHSLEYHAGVSIFLKTSTGEPIYFMRSRYWKFPSLFEDYMGRSYSGSKMREQFMLNELKWQQVKKDLYLLKVQQKVRYKQNEQKRVNHQQIF